MPASIVQISKTSRSIPPRLRYELIAKEVLGNSFSVSLVFIGDTRAKALNKTYRNKTYTPNVLTFPLSKTSGEIFINLAQAKREAKKHGVSNTRWVTQLFIHGLLHLKGMPHGATMDRIERALTMKFS